MMDRLVAPRTTPKGLGVRHLCHSKGVIYISTEITNAHIYPLVVFHQDSCFGQLKILLIVAPLSGWFTISEYE